MLTSMGAVEDATVVDLFAGTGALGIEALSRGAATATLVDSDPLALESVKLNLVTTGLYARATVVRADVMQWLPGAPAVDLAFADPPYDFGHWPALLGDLRAGVAVLESDHEIDATEGWKVLKAKRYGGTVVTIMALVTT